MANFELKFIDCVNPNYRLTINQSEYYSETFKTDDFKVIDIEIFKDGEDGLTFSMDISTAIKVAKTLRTEINKFKESENLIDGGSSFNTLEKGNFTTLTGTPKKGGQNGTR